MFAPPAILPIHDVLHPLTSLPSRLSNVTGQGIFSAFLFDLHPNRPIESVVTAKINVTSLPAYHSAINNQYVQEVLHSRIHRSRAVQVQLLDYGS
jgi:hypothetical protein